MQIANTAKLACCALLLADAAPVNTIYRLPRESE